MLTCLDAFDRACDGVLRFVILGTSAVLTLALTVLVICRYFLNISVVGMHDVSLLAAMWLYMAGAIAAARHNQQLQIDILALNLRAPRAKAIHALVVAVLTVIISGFFAFWVWKMLAWGMARPQTIQALNLPLWVAQAPVAIAAIAAILYGLRDVVRAIRLFTPVQEKA